MANPKLGVPRPLGEAELLLDEVDDGAVAAGRKATGTKVLAMLLEVEVEPALGASQDQDLGPVRRPTEDPVGRIAAG
jgi:hypothetical protein